MTETTFDLAVDVRDVRRVFDGNGTQKVALAGVSFTVGRGQVHGLLGPNGAGKTTLMKIMSTVLLPTAGTVTLLGEDVVDRRVSVRRNIGVVFGGDNGLYDRVGSRENLRFWGALAGVPRRALRPRVDELLELVGLRDVADVPVQSFSRGMKQRLHLARGLVGDPAVLFLDEPTVGMDPGSALEFRRMVEAIAADGQTMLMSTHDMDEAAELCSAVTMIDNGRVIEEPDLNSVLSPLPRRNVLQLPRLDTGVIEELVARFTREDANATVLPAHGTSGARIIFSGDELAKRHEVLLNDRGLGAASVERLTLRDVYLRAVGARGFQI